LAVKPVTVKVAGVPSEALAEAGETSPLVQDRLTVTEAPLLGTKSLLTVNWAELRVLVIVQVLLSPPASVTWPELSQSPEKLAV